VISLLWLDLILWAAFVKQLLKMNEMIESADLVLYLRDILPYDNTHLICFLWIAYKLKLTV
jgi:hypothetical protein